MKLLKKLNSAGKLIAAGNIGDVADATFNTIFPSSNRIFYWDRFYILVSPGLSTGVQHSQPSRQANLRFFVSSKASALTQLDLTARMAKLQRDTEATYNDRLEAGHKVAVAEDQSGNVVGFYWFIPMVTEYTSRSGYLINPREPEGVFPKDLVTFTWTHDLFIVPEYRGQGLAPMILAVIEESLSKEGSMGFACEIHYRNIASIRSHARLGYLPRLKVDLLRVANRTKFYKRLCG